MDNGVRVDLNSNRVFFGGRGIRVQPKQAEVAFMLLRNYPEALEVKDLVRGLYGIGSIRYSPRTEGPNERATVRSHVSILRRHLRSIHLNILNVDRRGYTLDIPTAEIDDRS